MSSPPAPFELLRPAFLSQGAEACVWGVTYLGRDAVLKTRLTKAYRHPSLDETLTRERLLGEARALARARRAGVDAPVPLLVDVPRASLVLERVVGVTLKAWLARAPLSDALAVAAHLGAAVAKLHAAGIAHGDLTTSNVMLRSSADGELDWPGGVGPPLDDTDGVCADPGDELDASLCSDDDGGGGVGVGEEEGGCDVVSAEGGGGWGGIPVGGGGASGSGDTAAAAAAVSDCSDSNAVLPDLPARATSVCLIDFGLASLAASAEDCGVDLYVLERAFSSTHASVAKVLFESVYETYIVWLRKLAPPTARNAAAVSAKFAAVRLRGRKRLAFG